MLRFKLTLIVLLGLSTVLFAFPMAASACWVAIHVYEDTNGNETQDNLEPDIVGVEVVITDSAGRTYEGSTNGNGYYTVHIISAGSTIFYVNEDTLPSGYVWQQTAGDNPTTVSVSGTGSELEPVYTDDNGYQPQQQNNPPLAVDDAYETDEDTQLIVDAPGVLGNDSDPDGDSLTVIAYDDTSNEGGTVMVNPDGSFTYTPKSGFCGIDTFTYTISDGNSGTDTAIVTITVNCGTRRSIQIESLDFELDWDRDSVNGNFLITNQSSPGLLVQIKTLEIVVEYRTRKQWTPVNATCTFQPEAPTTFSDQLTISFDCDLETAIPENNTVRVTAKVTIFGRDKVFKFSSSK
jgi:VCBS repeat-containing protein